MKYESKSDDIFSFAGFIFDSAHQLLEYTEGSPPHFSITLTHRVSDVLQLLLIRSGSVVERETFFDLVWRDTIVETGNLAVAITNLRKAFREAGFKEPLIETIPRVGYRFVGTVVTVERTVANADTDSVKSGLNSPLLSGAEISADISENGHHKQIQLTTEQLSVPANPKSGFFPFLLMFFERRILSSSMVVIAVFLLGFANYFTNNIVSSDGNSNSNSNSNLKKQETVGLIVIPFKNLTPEKTDSFLLGYAIADRTISAFARLKHVNAVPIWVAGAYAEKSTELSRIKAETGSNFLITGTYQIRDDRTKVFVSFQIVGTKDGTVLLDREFEVDNDPSFFKLQSLIVNRLIALAGIYEITGDTPIPFNANEVNQEAYKRYIQGLLKYEEANSNGAILEFEKASTIDPTHTPSLLFLAQTYIVRAKTQDGTSDDYAKAEVAITKAIALESGDFSGRVMLAEVMYDTGRYEQSIKLFKELLERDPRNPGLVYSLMFSYRYIGLLEESRRMTELYRELVPNAPLVATQYIYLGDYEEFIRLLSLEMRNGYVTFYWGYIYMHQGQKKLAIEHFDKAFSLSPKSLQPKTGFAFSYILKGQMDKASEQLAKLDREIALKQIHDGEGVYKVAQANAMAGHTKRALELFQMSIDNGFVPYTYFQNDPFMKNISNEPDFQRLVEQARQKHLGMTSSLELIHTH